MADPGQERGEAPGRNYMEPLHQLWRAARLWDHGAELPVPPPGHLFPVDAFNDAGFYLLTEHWNLTEMRASNALPGLPEVADTDFPGGVASEDFLRSNGHAYNVLLSVMWMYDEYEDIRPPIDAPVTSANWQVVHSHRAELNSKSAAADLRRRIVIRTLAPLLVGGQIKAVYRPKGGGDPEPMPSSWWQLDDPTSRFWRGGLDPDRPHDQSGADTAWFFIEKDSLMAALAPALPPTTTPAAAGVHLSSYIQFMIDVARQTRIGPEPHEQIPKESLKATIDEMGKKIGLVLTQNEIEFMATFVREPFMKQGSRTVMKNLREGSGSAGDQSR